MKILDIIHFYFFHMILSIQLKFFLINILLLSSNYIQNYVFSLLIMIKIQKNHLLESNFAKNNFLKIKYFSENYSEISKNN